MSLTAYRTIPAQVEISATGVRQVVVGNRTKDAGQAVLQSPANWAPLQSLFFGFRSSNTGTDGKFDMAFAYDYQSASGVRLLPWEKSVAGKVNIRFIYSTTTDLGISATSSDVKRLMFFGGAGQGGNVYPGGRIRLVHLSRGRGFLTLGGWHLTTGIPQFGYIAIGNTI